MKKKQAKAKSQRYSEDAAKKSGKEKRLANLIPFNTGYDARRNYHGRPRDIDQLRELVRDIGQHEVELKDGAKISRLYLKVLEMFDSKDPRDNALILAYGFGKVPDEVNLHTWQNEIIQAIKENLITKVEVIKVLGLENARPLLSAAGVSESVDAAGTITISDSATPQDAESRTGNDSTGS